MAPLTLAASDQEALSSFGPIFKLRYRQGQTFAIVHYFAVLDAARALEHASEIVLGGLALKVQ